MGISFKNVEVVKTKENFHYVMWDVASDNATAPPGPFPPEDDPSQYYFVIYWSNDPASGYHSIKDSDGNDIHIDGASGPMEYSVKHYRKHFNFNNKYYYCVVAYHKTIPSLATKSKPVYQGQFSDGVHIQIKFAEDTLYTMYYGEPCLIVKRKPFGEPCPNCWSEARQQRTKSNCSVCQNTGKVYGYYQPIEMQVSFDSDPVKSDVQKDYENVIDTKRGRISNYPMVKPRDLIINLDDNKRYTITHIETTKLPLRATFDKTEIDGKEVTLSKQNYVVSQMLTMQEINADDQEYFMNYCNIPEETDDYSLPRFQTHEPATGEAPITVDEDQVIRLNYSDDFDIDENGQLVLKNPLDNTGILEIDYLLNTGTNDSVVIPNITQNLIPGAEIVSYVRKIKLSIDKAGNVDGNFPAVARVASYTPNTTTNNYNGSSAMLAPGIGDTLVLKNFLEKAAFQGVKYYVYKDVEIDDSEIINIDPNKAVLLEIIPNGSWTFDVIRATVQIEMKVA
jgi:hypothetical protein